MHVFLTNVKHALPSIQHFQKMLLISIDLWSFHHMVHPLEPIYRHVALADRPKYKGYTEISSNVW